MKKEAPRVEAQKAAKSVLDLHPNETLYGLQKQAVRCLNQLSHHHSPNAMKGQQNLKTRN